MILKTPIVKKINYNLKIIKKNKEENRLPTKGIRGNSDSKKQENLTKIKLIFRKI